MKVYEDLTDSKLITKVILSTLIKRSYYSNIGKTKAKGFVMNLEIGLEAFVKYSTLNIY